MARIAFLGPPGTFTEEALQGYLPILSLCLTKKWLFSPLSYDTSASFVANTNYQPFTELVKEGVR